jgi:hypothetical protein
MDAMETVTPAEHRAKVREQLDRIEAKLDLLLEHSGVEPEEGGES